MQAGGGCAAVRARAIGSRCRDRTDWLQVWSSGGLRLRPESVMGDLELFFEHAVVAD
jgi:hypothetical protein